MKEIIFENGSVVKAIESQECVRGRGAYRFFRDATIEEAQSVSDYIESISTETGETFLHDSKQEGCE